MSRERSGDYGAMPGVSQPMSVTAMAGLDSQSDREFETIFAAHYERVVCVVARLVGDRVRAEDIANEVFWKLYQQPRSSALWGNVGAWLLKAAVHAGIDALRASGRRKRYENAASLEAQDQSAGHAGPLDDLVRAQECERVRRVLSGMKPAQAQLLLMRAGGATYKDLADALNVAASGVGTLLNRAEKEFRNRYLKIAGEEN